MKKKKEENHENHEIRRPFSAFTVAPPGRPPRGRVAAGPVARVPMQTLFVDLLGAASAASAGGAGGHHPPATSNPDAPPLPLRAPPLRSLKTKRTAALRRRPPEHC